MEAIINLPDGDKVIEDSDAIFDVYVGEVKIMAIGLKLTHCIPERHYVWVHIFDFAPKNLRALKRLAAEYLPKRTWILTSAENPRAKRYAEFFGFKEKRSYGHLTALERNA